MKYLFYPGCSQESSAKEYYSSSLAVLDALGAEVKELEDWTCCGASVASVMSDLLGLVLPARNLALAEKISDGENLIAVCSACYTNFKRTAEAASDPSMLEKINKALDVEGLTYQNKIQIRHILDVLANDFGAEAIASRVKRSLSGLTVALYYGCQTVRPYSPFDDGQKPGSMVDIVAALGATVLRHSHEALCCGTSLVMTKPEVGLGMAGAILKACKEADCVVTVCPMCHMNLDSYQDRVSRLLKESIKIPILFLPQLIGLAFGLPMKDLMLQRLVTSAKTVLAKVS